MTTTLDQSRKLYELGVRKESEKGWAWTDWEHSPEPEPFELISLPGTNRDYYSTLYPAYNAEELIAMMQLNNRPQLMIVYDRINKWQVMLLDIHPVVLGDNITQALATRLIYDLENNIISLEEINK